MVNPKLSIVIVNYNVKDLLVTCIRSICQYQSTKLSFEIIVVDNASNDNSVQAIKDEFPEVILIENERNEGFPKANNQGFEIAKGEFIFMLNPDTEFIEDTLQPIIDYFKSHPDVQLLGPKLLNTDRSLQRSFWRFPTIQSIFLESVYLSRLNYKKEYREKNVNETFEAESFSGAAICFRREVLNQLSGLDETMFWIEDVDFCYRANLKGLKCVYFPEVQIIHHIGQSAKKNYNISISNQIVNKIKFFRKHHSTFAASVISLISFLHVLSKIIVFAILSPFNVIYYRKFKAYLYTLPKVFNPPIGIA